MTKGEILHSNEHGFIERRIAYVVVAWQAEEGGIEGEDVIECETLAEAREEFEAYVYGCELEFALKD